MGNFQENSDICRKSTFPHAIFFILSQYPAVLDQHQQVKQVTVKDFKTFSVLADSMSWVKPSWSIPSLNQQLLLFLFFIYPTSLWLFLLLACSSFCWFIGNFHWGLLAVAQYHPSFFPRPTVTPNAIHQAHLPIMLAMTACISRHWLFHYIYCRYSYFGGIFWFSFYVINWSSATLNC